jgi:hypothetical protein
MPMERACWKCQAITPPDGGVQGSMFKAQRSKDTTCVFDLEL